MPEGKSIPERKGTTAPEMPEAGGMTESYMAHAATHAAMTHAATHATACHCG
jgi:hypothetical protein